MIERHGTASSIPAPGGRPGGSERGAVMILAVVGLAALLAIAGLALDTSYLVLNKSRVQTAVDAAALAAAKRLDESHDTVLSEIAARQIFADNAAAPGNDELKRAYDGGNGDISVSVQFSSSLNPFVPGSYQAGVTPDGYVRVRAFNFNWSSWFVTAVGIDQLETNATAVAGPSPTLTKEDEVCDLAPMMVCGIPEESAPSGTYLGYELDDIQIMKSSTTNGNWEVGPGNFQLVRLEGGQGGDDVREAMAGGGIGCVDSSEGIETEPGNTVGPVVQGINTRFGTYSGPLRRAETRYPPDVVTTENESEILKEFETNNQSGETEVHRITVTHDDGSQCVKDFLTGQETMTQSGTTVCDSTTLVAGADTPEDPDDDVYEDCPLTECLSFKWDNYSARVGPGAHDYPPPESGASGTIGHRWRRVMKLPVGDCSGTTSGQGTVPYIGSACFFLLQQAEQQGNESHVYGTFIRGCDTQGEAGPEPNNGPGGYRIVLYKDPDSSDS